ncbi:MAG: DUF2178 domain-containing protein [Candidatus Methanoperedens sp.]|nr:DUF2178 domain-containing protein [Candidatus Methanoperedens sp.]
MKFRTDKEILTEIVMCLAWIFVTGWGWLQTRNQETLFLVGLGAFVLVESLYRATKPKPPGVIDDEWMQRLREKAGYYVFVTIILALLFSFMISMVFNINNQIKMDFRNAALFGFFVLFSLYLLFAYYYRKKGIN